MAGTPQLLSLAASTMISDDDTSEGTGMLQVTQSRGTPVAYMIDNMYSLLAEDMILSLGPGLSAHMNTGGNEPLLPKSDSNTSTAVSKTLQRLGFKMEGSDTWAVLGINKMEGPMPSQEDLNNRFHISQSIAMLAMGESSTLDSKARAHAFLELAAFHA